MRIQAQYNFYFDYLIPRLDQPLALKISDPKYDAYIHGWDRADPLFFDEIGQTLSSMQIGLQSVQFREIRKLQRVKDICVDRLQVVIEWESESLPDDSAIAESLDRAVRVGNSVLEHLRVVARAPLARLIDRYWKPGNPIFAITVPHTETWINLDDDSWLPVFKGVNSTCSSGAITVPETGAATFGDFTASIVAGPHPALHLSLLVDAEFALMSLRIREAILNIASACDIHAGLYLKNQTLISQTQARNTTKINGTFAEKYFHELTSAVCSKSLKQDKPEVFSDIEATYEQRNSLIHAGKLRGNYALLGEIQKHHQAMEWLVSAHEALEWLDSLPR